ncbi:MAG: 1-phosphofructokinase family hexose kinase [Clostridia bacterium]|nr:1-phosphofructokinase family hexose kinase [Clostridia bacterium]
MRICTLTLNPALDRSMIFDTFTAGELNRAISSVTTVGGKGINVSRALKVLGTDATAYGFSGGDNGEAMKRMLKQEGVSFNFTQTDAPTRMNIKITDRDGNATEASESGGPVTKEETEKLFENLDTLFCSDKKPDYFVISGSIPKGQDRDIYKKIIEKAAEKDIKCVLDCDGDALKYGVEAMPFLIKPNKKELEQYSGHYFANDNEMISFACNLSEKFRMKIIITLGADGAYFVDKDTVYKTDAPKVTMKGFTGAGDSFLASFLDTYLKTGDTETALRTATSFSAAKVELEGTLLPDYQMGIKYKDSINCVKIRG